jgi:hypothetical protein
MRQVLLFLLLPFLVLALASCSRSVDARIKLAASTAQGHLPIHGFLGADTFILATYGRVAEPGATARVYIEGDGLAYMGRSEPSLDPTPTNPVALNLAALDPAPNVVWIARPCQYEKFSLTQCSQEYWTSKRFAPEVIAAYTRALDMLKTQYHFTGFELVGFSGGGAVAALAAAGRSDVINLRTVGGNLDHEAFNAYHQVSPMPQSLNPRDVAVKLAHLPQRHFTGAKDDIVPSLVYDSYARAAGPSTCLHHDIVEGVSHEKGWEAEWPQLLARPVSCN